MAKLLILNGPNLNLLGEREPGHYGSDTLATINQRLEGAAQAAGHALTSFQSNAEHELVNQVHAAKKMMSPLSSSTLPPSPIPVLRFGMHSAPPIFHLLRFIFQTYTHEKNSGTTPSFPISPSASSAGSGRLAMSWHYRLPLNDLKQSKTYH